MFNIDEIKNKIKENEVYFMVKFENENKQLLEKLKMLLMQKLII